MHPGLWGEGSGSDLERDQIVNLSFWFLRTRWSHYLRIVWLSSEKSILCELGFGPRQILSRSKNSPLCRVRSRTSAEGRAGGAAERDLTAEGAPQGGGTMETSAFSERVNCSFPPNNGTATVPSSKHRSEPPTAPAASPPHAPHAGAWFRP